MADHPQMNELADEHGMDLHYGRKEKPGEHVHEWRIDWFTNRIFCPYKKCQKELTNKEIMRRLNAVERLSAEDAIELAVSARAAGSITDQQLADKADAYAAELEKK